MARMIRLSFYIDEADYDRVHGLIEHLRVRTMSELFRRMISNYADLVEGRLVPTAVIREAKSISQSNKRRRDGRREED